MGNNYSNHGSVIHKGPENDYLEMEKPLVESKFGKEEDNSDIPFAQEASKQSRHRCCSGNTSKNNKSSSRPDKVMNFSFEVNAPKSVVWKVLSNGNKYGEWHPFIKTIDASLPAGSKTTVQTKDGHVCKEKMEILANDFESEFTTRAKLGWFVTFVSSTRLTENYAGKTIIDHQLRFNGFVSRFFPTDPNHKCKKEMDEKYHAEAKNFIAYCEKAAEKEFFAQELQQIDADLAVRFADIVDYPLSPRPDTERPQQ